MVENKPQFGRRELGLGTKLLLVSLRIYVLAAVPLVVYAFIRAMH